MSNKSIKTDKAKDDWLLNHLPEFSLVHTEYGHKNKKRMLAFKKT